MDRLYPSAVGRPAERGDGAAAQAERCGGEEHVGNGFMKGPRRYRREARGPNFTGTPPRAA